MWRSSPLTPWFPDPGAYECDAGRTQCLVPDITTAPRGSREAVVNPAYEQLFWDQAELFQAGQSPS